MTSLIPVSGCLVPRSLSFDENVRPKEGGKETTSVPFPWSLAVHHQSLAFRARLYDAKNEAPEEAEFQVFAVYFRLMEVICTNGKRETGRNFNLLAQNFACHLPKPWTKRFADVNCKQPIFYQVA